MKPAISKETPTFQRGDIIVNKGSGNSYVVIDIVDGQVIAARTLTVSNPSEWEQYPVDFNKLSSGVPTNPWKPNNVV